MKKLIVFLILIFAFLFTALLYTGGTFAYADSPVLSVSLTSTGEDNAEIPYDGLTYARGIKAVVTVNAPRLKYTIYEYTGSGFSVRSGYPKYATPAGNTVTLNIVEEGNLKLELVAQNEFGTVEYKTLSVNVKSDNTAPVAPDIDLEQFSVYHLSPFNIAYTLKRDGISGLDFLRSKYYYEGVGGVRVAESFLIDDYDEKFIDNIDRNGTLFFELYDLAGNKGFFSYQYMHYGYPESEAPSVTVTPETGYTQSVLVSISWGESYDSHPNARKEYTLETSAGKVTRPYTEPFTVQTEGLNTLTVYYYNGGEKKAVTREISNVDRIPPSQNLMKDTFAIYCDIRAEIPLYVTVKATDLLSGIKKVYIQDGADFFHIGDGFYKASVLDLPSFVIVAEDNAGNKAQYGVYGFSYDYAAVREAAELYRSLDLNAYSPNGRSAIEAAASDFSSYVVSENATSTEITKRKRALAAAAEGIINETTRIAEIPDGLSGAFTFDMSKAVTGIKKGGTLKIIISKPVSTADVNSLKTLSGYGTVYGFKLDAQDESNTSVAVSGSVYFTAALSGSVSKAKLYFFDGQTFTEITSHLEDGTLSATVSSFGDFYIAAAVGNGETPKGFVIGTKFYSYTMLGIAGGIVGGGIVLTAIIVLIIKKRRTE